MKYRYLDIRREPVKENLIFRHELSLEVRNYLSENSFIDVETPYLIKSTPEGARDFIVPSRLKSRSLLRFTSITSNFQTIINGWWN